MCQPTIVIFIVYWAHESLVAHGHSPPHSRWQGKCGVSLSDAQQAATLAAHELCLSTEFVQWFQLISE